MCTTNARVNEFNDAVIDAMDPANVATLRSYDRIDSNETGEDLHGEVLDMLGHRGVPPHSLRLNDANEAFVVNVVYPSI